MASGDECKRYSPVGREFEPEDKDLNRTIEFYLDVFRTVIVQDLDYQIFLMYPHFSLDQKKELHRMGKNESNSKNVVEKGLEMLEELENHPTKYTDFLDLLQDEDYQKISRILKGEIIPNNDRNRNHINMNLRSICQNVNPEEIVAMLLKKKVIVESELQTIRNVQRSRNQMEAMLELMFILPTRSEHWYPHFIEALLDMGSGVAEKIDNDLCEKLKQRRGAGDLEDQTSLLDEYKSYVTVTDDCSDIKYTETSVKTDSSTDVRMHVMEDFHEASIEANNLSPAEKPLKEEESMSDDPDRLQFDSMLENNDNVHHKQDNNSLNQSVSMREPHSELTRQRTSLPGVNQSDLNTDDSSLDFPSLLGETEKTSSTQNLNKQEMERRSMPQQKLSSFTRDLGDGGLSFNTESAESYKPGGSSLASNSNVSGTSVSPDDNDQTALKTFSIESNDRVTISAAVSDQQRAVKAFSRTLRDNSRSPDLKVLPDKNMDVISGAGALNIQNDEPDMDSQTPDEEVEDVDISLRGYQQELADPALKGKNVIIVAPTGSGKTRVALRIIQEHIRNQQGRGIGKVIFLVNQVALANQQGDECVKQLKRYKSKVVSGETQRGRREYLKDFIDKRDILIVTAQVLMDSLTRKEIAGLHVFSLMVFDECHHTHANHTFNQIMGMYMDLKFSKDPPQLPQIVGLTASVGVGKARNEEKAVEHIKKLMANLDAQVICTVQNNMKELRDYVALPDEETFTVSKRENDIFGESVIKLMTTIEKMMTISSVVKEMEEASQFEKVLKPPAAKGSAQYTQWVSKLWKETAKLRSHEARRFLNPCRTHLEHYNNALIIHNDARVQDALSYLDREMKKWRDQAKGYMDENEQKLDRAFNKLRNYKEFDRCSDNPKLEKLRDMIVKAYARDQDNSRGIVFVRTRELAKAIISWMKETPGLRQLNPIQFLGQNPHADKGGMTKAEQDDVLNYFKDGKHKLIVATSVAEEGLDISKCNLVIRYDHVTNEIAMVQSRGRGRAKDSKYYVIAEEGTGMAEKEELNMIREIMMRKAIIKLQEEIVRNPDKFCKDLHHLQEEADLDHKLKKLSVNKRRLTRAVGHFELQCQKCSKYICMSQDLKKIQQAHHVIVDESLKERVDFVKTETEEPAVEMNQPIGKLSCKGCGENLGVIALHRNLEFPVPKIEKFLIVDNNGRQSTGKRWKDVPFVVSDLTKEDFKNIIEKRGQDGAL